ncbi:MAG: hypothetical protein Q4D16_07725 [Eubacteriales bacterium]|nr:hypothetical protein [Eubacteriales bacterium]
MRRKGITYLVPYCVIAAMMLSACEKAPENTVKDGALVSESTDNKVKSANDSNAKERERLSPQEILQSFPSHYTKEFSAGTNCLCVDADIVIPAQDIKLYQADVLLDPWSEEQVRVVSAKLEEAGLLSGSELPEAFDYTSQVPLVGITYSNSDLSKQEKSGTLQGGQEEEFSQYLEDFCRIFAASGLPVRAEPQNDMEGNWDGRTYSLAATFEEIPLAAGFPATGTGRIINEFTGGSVTFSEDGIVDFFMNEKFNFTNQEECKSLASMETIANTLQAALDSAELIFSRDLKAVKLSLEYLIVSESEHLQMIPVWNVTFDVDAYYHALEESTDQEQKMSMMNLCINAVDGSVAYAS